MFNIIGQDDGVEKYMNVPRSMIMPDLPPIEFRSARDYQKVGGVVVPPVVPTGGIQRPFIPENEDIIRSGPYTTLPRKVSVYGSKAYSIGFIVGAALVVGAVIIIGLKMTKSEDEESYSSNDDDCDEDEDKEEDEDEDVYFIITDRYDHESLVMLKKDYGRWEEHLIAGKKPYGFGGKSYMSYLKPEDLLGWLSHDYDNVEPVEPDEVDEIKERIKERIDEED